MIYEFKDIIDIFELGRAKAVPLTLPSNEASVFESATAPR
jgi:hypothetical protein